MIGCNVLKNRGRGGPVDVERRIKTRRGGSDCYTSFKMGVSTSWKQLKGREERGDPRVPSLSINFLDQKIFTSSKF